MIKGYLSAQNNAAAKVSQQIDVLLMYQVESLRKGRNTSGEKRLLMRILEDAIWVLLERKNHNAKAVMLYQDTVHWIESERENYPFAFNPVCEALELSPDYIRRLIQESNDVER